MYFLLKSASLTSWDGALTNSLWTRRGSVPFLLGAGPLDTNNRTRLKALKSIREREKESELTNISMRIGN